MDSRGCTGVVHTHVYTHTCSAWGLIKLTVYCSISAYYKLEIPRAYSKLTQKSGLGAEDLHVRLRDPVVLQEEHQQTES